MGPNPTQGFLKKSKEDHIKAIEPPVNIQTVLPNSVRNIDKIDWGKFKDYLDKNFHKYTVKARLSYAKKYYNVLVNEDAKELMNLSFDKRIHVMKALATLSKFLGCYDKWKEIVEKYQLKWSNNCFIA